MAGDERIGGARVVIAPDAASWAESAATEVRTSLATAVAQRATATFCLAGGSTPAPLYARLAAPGSYEGLDWSGVRFLWGDERCVPPHRPESNYRLARERLLEPLAVAPDKVFRIPAELGAVAAASAYEATLRGLLGEDPPCLDLVLLGIGRDGHTASLFPGAEEPGTEERWVIPARAPEPPTERVSLSLRVLNGARKVVFLVRGAKKSAMVARILRSKGPIGLPASRVRPPAGELVWLLDQEAARGLEVARPLP